MRREEERHAAHEPEAVDPRRKGAVRRHEGQEEHRLSRRRVALDDGAALAEDQRLPHDLQDRVERQQAEHVGGEQQGARAFSGTHVGED